jgi:Mrp family chromosome partitioning ATPase
VRVLAEIPARPAQQLRPAALRRCDLEAFEGLARQLAGAGSVLLTGSRPGAPAAAIGLATAAAVAGTRTALVECDLADPRLADALGLANAPGLHEYLLGRAGVEEVLSPVVLAGPASGAAEEPLVCVVAGRPAADAPRLLASEAFAGALAGLRQAYELLVLAAPRLDEWESLGPLLSQADATVACIGRAEAGRGLPFAVTGAVIED